MWEKEKWLVTSNVRRGEIACDKQFLLFPQSFQKACTADTYKPGLVWERAKSDVDEENFYFFTMLSILVFTLHCFQQDFVYVTR